MNPDLKQVRIVDAGDRNFIGLVQDWSQREETDDGVCLKTIAAVGQRAGECDDRRIMLFTDGTILRFAVLMS